MLKTVSPRLRDGSGKFPQPSVHLFAHGCTYLEDALDVVKLPSARLQQDSRPVGDLVEVLPQTRAA